MRPIDTRDPLPGGNESSEETRCYVPPRLEVLGDVRELTLGASPGAGDSSGPQNTNSPQG
jgi:hypothetical protein